MRETARDISFCAHAILNDGLFVIEDATCDPRFADNPLVVGEPHVVFYAGRPLKNAEGYTVGTLCLIDHKPRRFGRADRRSLDDLGCWVEQIFLSRELSTSQQAILGELDQAKRASLLDPMLNIWNRAAFIDMVQRERERAVRQHTPLSLMMIDVDRFKHINDNYGHPVGDAVLIEIAKRLLSATRSYDSLGRYGGDEFVAALPETDTATAMEIAQRLVDSMHEPLTIGDTRLNLSISIGIACAPGEGTLPSEMELLRRADQALLSAKRHGKNCFHVFAPEDKITAPK